MLEIKIPKSFSKELSWLFRVILDDFFNIPYEIETVDDDKNVYIETTSKSIKIPNIFLFQAKKNWLDEISLPKKVSFLTLEKYFNKQFHKPDLPVFFGKPNIKFSENEVFLKFDLIGTLFFFLSGYEGASFKRKDEHERFKLEDSILFQHNLIFRALVDEYCEVLWHLLEINNKNLKRKPTEVNLEISCDVDVPFTLSSRSFFLTLKTIVGDILKRNNVFIALKNFLNYFFTKINFFYFDPLNTFNLIMDVNEIYGNKVIFYFILNQNSFMDGEFSLKDTQVKVLLNNIIKRGHKIGLHASYNSFKDFSLFSKEVEMLKELFKKKGISNYKIHNRQHYLRWCDKKTPHILNASGVDFDSSVYFASSPGFRAGTSKEFRMFDLEKRESLNLIQKPLLIMEESMLSDKYLGLKSKKEIFKMIDGLVSTIRYHGGNITLLWHNSSLQTRFNKKIYKEILKRISD